MTPSVRRIMGTCRSAMLLTEKPLIMIRPAVGTSSPVSILIMVDFPDPEGPTKNTNSPSSMAALIPRMARVPLGYSISTSFRRIIKQSPYSLSNRPVPMGSGRHNTTYSHIIYGFSGHCNVSLQIPFKVFPGKFFRIPTAPAPWKAVFCFENSLRSDKKPGSLTASRFLTCKSIRNQCPG